MKSLKHFLIPHESNNQKAKILHTDSLFILIIFLIGFQLLLSFFPKKFPSVLGYSSNISPGEVITLTNQQRAANGLPLLSENKTLNMAALAKGNDMISKGYWAHFAPDGTSPWNFFTNFGYKYQYAGENLARDFTNAQDAVDAWMNSPSHKENILNSHYKEIGIGVVQGLFSGAETTIIVQFFGTPLGGNPSISVAKAQGVSSSQVSVLPKENILTVQTPAPSYAPEQTSVLVTPKVSPFQSTKSVSLGILGLLLIVLSVDLIVVKYKRITRISGRTLAHISYLGMILAVILLLKAGQII